MAVVDGTDFVAVLPDKRFPGIDRAQDISTVPAATICTIEQAIGTKWPTDAHVLLYGPSPCDPRDPFVRCNKPSLPSLREQGVDLILRRIFVEWDTGKGPAHVPWTPDLWRRFEEQLAKAEQDPKLGPILAQCAAWYTTRKGCRWWFELAQPISVDHGEPLIRGLVSIFRGAGLEVDDSPTVQTWTQPFRLPYVVRDGVSTEGDWPGIVESYGRRLSLDGIPKVGEVDRPTGFAVSDDQPSPEDALEILWDFEAKKPTPFFREAKKSLVGKDYHGFVFENVEMSVEEGDRHDTILKWVASAVSLLVAHGVSTKPSQIYALFLKQVEQFDDDGGRRNWPNELWRMVVDLWGKEQSQQASKKQAIEEKKKQDEVRQVLLHETIVNGVRSWHPDLPKDPVTAWAWVRRRMIAATSSGYYYLMTEDGRYTNVPVKARQVIPQILHFKLETVIPVTRADDGGPRQAKVDEILEDHSINVCDIQVLPQIDGGFLSPPDAKNPSLVLLSFRRNPKLKPEFHPGVDEWIRSIAGVSRTGRSLYETLSKQIGMFLAFERGAVCLMSFRMSTGAGKKLLVHGFMETLEKPSMATSRDLVDRFSPGLLTSPFFSVNEGWELTSPYSHVADTIRKLVTGDIHTVNQKNKPEIIVRFPYRGILTANNDGLILGLTQNRDLAPDDREALAVRIQQYSPGDAPAKLLEAKGGWNWTRGWIAGDGDGEASQFIVAKHFLWLYEKYGKNATPTKRGMLMTGDPDCSPIDFMRTQGGSTPVVIETVVKALNSAMTIDGTTGVMIEDGRLFVVPGPLLDYWRKNLTGGASDRLTLRKVSNALKGLLLAGGLSGEKPVRIGGVQQRWLEIDVVLVAAEAEMHGWMCPRLDALVKARTVHVGVNGNGHGVPAGVGA